MNKVIPDKKFIENWMEMCYDTLDCMSSRKKTVIEQLYDPNCSDSSRIDFAENESRCLDSSETKYLLPHEFLYLICNAEDRVSHIMKTKKGPGLNLNKKIIKDFDFIDKRDIRVGSKATIIQKDPCIYLPSSINFEGTGNAKNIMSMSISQIKKDQGSSKSRINNYDDQKTTAEVTGILKTLEEKNSKLSDDLKQDISRFRYYKVENKMVKRRTDIIIKKESNRRGSKTKRDSSSKKNSQIGVVTTGKPVPIPRIPTEKIQPGTQRSRQTINLSSLKNEKRDAKTDIFSKTAVEVHSSDQKKPKKLKRSGTGPINYISKNKQLGRVADINKRRFSKLFCPIEG